MISKGILSILLLVIIAIISILTMIYGWGLEPVSWGWIIGAALAQFVIMGIVALIKDE